MLAYHRPGEPAQLGLPQTYVYYEWKPSILADLYLSIGTPEVTQIIANLSALYSPELEVGYSPVGQVEHHHKNCVLI